MFTYTTIYDLLFVVLVTVALRSAAGANYCERSLCPTGKHIACNNSGNFLSSCPPDAKMVTLSREMRRLLVQEHNSRRNYVAGGNVDKLPNACRMATMQWDAELARLAAFNVRQCKMQHDACRNTDRFQYSGQNIVLMSTTKKGLDRMARLKQAVRMFYEEVKFTKPAYIRSFPANYKGPDIGHFTVMMAEKNIRVGCAAATYKSGKFNNFLVACNYATTNVYGLPIYSSCNKAGEKCTTGTNRKYKNLCSEAEVYAVNEITSNREFV